MTNNHTAPEKSGPLSKGVYLLPNLLTIASLFAGFYAIVAAMKGLFDTSAIAIFIGMVFDALDGRVARLTNTQTAFGAQFDSLSDMVCCGVAPALLLYQWALHALGKPGWLAAFVYCVCTALRLARFNIQAPDKRYFFGLPTPAAAGAVASYVWVCVQQGLSGVHQAFGVAMLAIVLALLKVSQVRYRSFKDIDLKGKVPFIAVLVAMLVIVLISIDPPHLLFLFFIGYALSGPLMFVWNFLYHRGWKK